MQFCFKFAFHLHAAYKVKSQRNKYSELLDAEVTVAQYRFSLSTNTHVDRTNVSRISVRFLSTFQQLTT